MLVAYRDKQLSIHTSIHSFEPLHSLLVVSLLSEKSLGEFCGLAHNGCVCVACKPIALSHINAPSMKHKEEVKLRLI